MTEPGWPFGGRPTPRRLWALWKAGRLMECEINAHPLGHEVRVYVQQEFLWSQVFPSEALAEAEAIEMRQHVSDRCWQGKRN